MRQHTCTLTVGVARSGKTYVSVVWIVETLLKDPSARIVTNLPLCVDKIAEYVAERDGREEEEVLEQIEIIPREEIQKWERERSGPWEYFAGRSIARCHVAIDEAHKVANIRHSKEHHVKWQEWLGELGHQGATFEMITQSEQKIPSFLKSECGVRYYIENRALRRDPFFGVLFGDWTELKAAFTGNYVASSTRRQLNEVGGALKEPEGSKVTYDRVPLYFAFYDSFSAPNDDSVKADGPQFEYQRRSKLGMVKWFLGRNWTNLAFNRITAVFAVIMFLTTGGAQYVLSGVTDRFITGLTGKSSKVEAKRPHPVPKPRAVNVTGEAGRRQLPPPETTSEVVYRPASQVPATIKGVLSNAVITETGERVEFGCEVMHGRFSGLVVSCVDHDRGRVCFSDGSEVAFGIGKTGSVVPGPIRSDPQPGQGDGSRFIQPPRVVSSDDLRRTAPARIDSAGPEQPDGGNDPRRLRQQASRMLPPLPR